ncbi:MULTISPECIES: glycoside hydrolase family 13 protein [unclassified Clostridioides]|uniref:glycoside hydrolase family 13 protein n=1 Tax=unclassified Clostridioides TaxID=2635829 RepID=UPI001D11B660|nr:alpha-glucosidase C-terminal domain-containing protein [Clostridioides sp. ZZV14-6104]MCC0728789.1 alpha-glucosidase C-terminal domain-containing protein [Clostridioides sp. ZZV14-6045]MCC0732226.1 alpha-glucosidase C-terminal domain-containing protein [Clostridioides sp. ZZV14-6048]MCC0736329.1 alpha-glucosidase C-terminal domain-containing protein [Clostridioides sp. ZZV14-6009]MCC0752313.1 alpha-glucosidase C-terminal domain-containing protein [Clostridioides sp. ZZV13-5731]
MQNIIEYNSWDKNFKAPFGALKFNEELIIKVKVNEGYNVESISLEINKEDETKTIILNEELNNNTLGKYFYCKVEKFDITGVYFYYFKVIVEIDGEKKTVFYGKNRENGYACEYNYNDINKYQITVYKDFKVPTWYKEGVLYHIFVDRFNNGNRNGKVDNPKKNSFIYGNWEDIPMYIKDSRGDIIRWDFHGGNLRGIINKLGYLKKLGVSILYLSPIFEASSNHKYDTGNYKNIDPMFGDEDTFKELIDKAKEKDISIVLDGVFSHTGADSKYFNMYGNYDSLGAYQSEESPYYSWYMFEEFPHKYKSWWDIKTLPNTNELEKSYMDYIIYDKDSVVNKWMNMGIKGWRLDVADELPTEFIRELKKELKEADNDSILIGEVWEDASNKISYGQRRSYLLGEELDSVMGYPFRNNMFSFLKGEINSYELSNRYIQIKENYPKESFKSNLNLIGTHDVTRAKTELNNDIDLMKLAVATQMTFEGVPYIYYGDEAGLCGDVDPDNRRTYPWKNEDEDMLNFYKNIIKIRNKNKILSSGETEFIYTRNDNVFAFIRFNEDNDRILILINRSNNPENMSLNIEGSFIEEIPIKYNSKNVNKNIPIENNELKIHMDSKSFIIFSVF